LIVAAKAEMKFAVAAALSAAERAAAESTRAGIEAARIAVLVDLAAVELRALVLVAHHVIGARDFLKLLLGVVALRGVGVIFLRERAEGLLDLGLGRGFGNA